MSTSVSEDFVLLEQDRHDMLGGQFLTRPTSTATNAGPVLLGIDAHGLRHLLVPTTLQAVPEDRRSAGVALVGQILTVGSSEVLYADLVCRAHELSLVFERLVEDVLNRLDGSESETTPVLHETLDEWRRLFESSPRGLGRDAAVGLIGELVVLERLAQDHPNAALEAWRGPRRSIHDFVVPDRALEVKSTASVDGNTVEISNLDQLDSADLTDLRLVVVHLRPDDAAPSIDDRIRSLLRMGVPRTTFLDLLAQLGHIFEARDADEHRYVARRTRVWEVNDDFPGLRRSRLENTQLRGVSSVTYQLAVDSIGQPQDEEVLDAWVS